MGEDWDGSWMFTGFLLLGVPLLLGSKNSVIGRPPSGRIACEVAFVQEFIIFVSSFLAASTAWASSIWVIWLMIVTVSMCAWISACTMAASPPRSWSSNVLSNSRSAFDLSNSYSRVKFAASWPSAFPSTSARPFSPTLSAVSILLVQTVRSNRRWQCCRVCSSSADIPTAVSLIAVTWEGISSFSRTSLTLSNAAIHDEMSEMRFSAVFRVRDMFSRSRRSGSESA